jgi:hypothetical protein
MTMISRFVDDLYGGTSFYAQINLRNWTGDYSGDF